METIGYIRVSTKEQNTARQDSALQGLCTRIYEEKISGKNMARPELKKMLDYVREGDVVIVESYSRLARDTQDLLKIVGELEKKGVAFRSLKEAIDTSTPQGRLMMTIFAGLAQFERESILQKQAEGIAEAKKRDAELKAQGLPAETYKGRKPISVNDNLFIAECKAWRAGTQTARETMKHLGLKPNTFYRRVRKLEL